MLSVFIGVEVWQQRSLRVALVCLAVLAAGCGEEAVQSSTATEAEPAVTETQRLNAWFDERYEEGLAFSPISKAFLGIKDEDYGRIGDFSEQGLDEVLAWRIRTAEALRTQFEYAALTEAGQESYEVWLAQHEMALAADQFRRHEYLFNQFSSIHRRLPLLLIAWHDVDNLQDLEHYVSRIRASAVVLHQLIERARLAAEGGVHAPYFAFEVVLAETQRLSQGWPLNGEEPSVAADATALNPIWADFASEVERLSAAGKLTAAQVDAMRAEGIAALRDSWAPALSALTEWLNEDRANAMQPATGVGSLPDGADYYRERLAFHTTTSLSADEIHAIGLANVTRLHQDIDAVQAQVGYEGSLQDFFAHLRNAKDDPRFYFPNTDAGRQGYLDESTALLDNIKRQLPQFFGLQPKADLEVRRVEAFREQAGAAQHYNVSSADGSRPGIYYAHLLDMQAMPRYQMESVAYHEGLPGHHMQLAIAAELQGVPEFRKRAFMTAYTEGWGLYAEGLAKEVPGTYVDPYSEVGRLGAELWRAIRLVVDTGLHAQGWTEQQAIDYMAANSGNDLAQIRSEIRRYIVAPGQATAYMIGNLKIRELRAVAADRLQADFDLRAFHDVILGTGPLPLNLLERKVLRWIERHEQAQVSG
ncbi:MAG: DUF885 domain-containing protein [Pseudomonadota bacterium]